MVKFNERSSRHLFPIGSNRKKPHIPEEMQQYIIKKMRNKDQQESTKKRTPPIKLDALDFIGGIHSAYLPHDNDGIRFESHIQPIKPIKWVDPVSYEKERLTSTASFAFDERIQKVSSDFDSTREPFKRHVIYLTPDSLGEAFDLLNRVSAARLLFDANISAELKEDQDKSLWYLEVVL